MSKRQLLMILGVWVMVLLFLGFPSNWDKIIALVTGAFIVWISYSMRRTQISSAKAEHIPYVEHTAGPAATPSVHVQVSVATSEPSSPITNDNTQTG